MQHRPSVVGGEVEAWEEVHRLGSKDRLVKRFASGTMPGCKGERAFEGEVCVWCA